MSSTEKMAPAACTSITAVVSMPNRKRAGIRMRQNLPGTDPLPGGATFALLQPTGTRMPGHGFVFLA